MYKQCEGHRTDVKDFNSFWKNYEISEIPHTIVELRKGYNSCIYLPMSCVTTLNRKINGTNGVMSAVMLLFAYNASRLVIAGGTKLLLF